MSVQPARPATLCEDSCCDSEPIRAEKDVVLVVCTGLFSEEGQFEIRTQLSSSWDSQDVAAVMTALEHISCVDDGAPVLAESHIVANALLDFLLSIPVNEAAKSAWHAVSGADHQAIAIQAIRVLHRIVIVSLMPRMTLPGDLHEGTDAVLSRAECVFAHLLAAEAHWTPSVSSTTRIALFAHALVVVGKLLPADVPSAVKLGILVYIGLQDDSHAPAGAPAFNQLCFSLHGSDPADRDRSFTEAVRQMGKVYVTTLDASVVEEMVAAAVHRLRHPLDFANDQIRVAMRHVLASIAKGLDMDHSRRSQYVRALIDNDFVPLASSFLRTRVRDHINTDAGYALELLSALLAYIPTEVRQVAFDAGYIERSAATTRFLLSTYTSEQYRIWDAAGFVAPDEPLGPPPTDLLWSVGSKEDKKAQRYHLANLQSSIIDNLAKQRLGPLSPHMLQGVESVTAQWNKLFHSIGLPDLSAGPRTCSAGCGKTSKLMACGTSISRTL